MPGSPASRKRRPRPANASSSPATSSDSSGSRPAKPLRAVSTSGWPRGRLLRRRHELKLRVLGEYRPLELSETFSRLDPELLHQRPASILVGLQRVRLAIRAVEGEHQLRPKPLSVRMVADQRLELYTTSA